MKRKAEARLAAMEQRLAGQRNVTPLADRIRSWQLQGLLAQHEAIRHGLPDVDWPKLPPDVQSHERQAALAIAARMDQEAAEFLTTYPEYREVIEGRRDRGGEVRDADP